VRDGSGLRLSYVSSIAFCICWNCDVSADFLGYMVKLAELE
jgi:hypothetical protein